MPWNNWCVTQLAENTDVGGRRRSLFFRNLRVHPKMWLVK